MALEDDRECLYDIDYYRGQFTGLKDENGVEIYEGDIIDSDATHIGGNKDTYEVVWNEDLTLGYGWGLWSTTGGGFRPLDGFSIDKVIGNIYESYYD